MHHKSALCSDPSYPEINEETFTKHDWTKFYGDVKEAKPPDMPDVLGKEVVMRYFMDADHAGEKLTRRSRSVLIIF